MEINKEIKLPDDITLEWLAELYNKTEAAYRRAITRAVLLDATDRGLLWSALGGKYPKNQIKADTNHVSYVKENIMASIYTVGKSASILPTSEEDKHLVTEMNVLMEHLWHRLDIGHYQAQAGERAALLNLGITQVGWDNNIAGGTSSQFSHGTVAIKNIDPMKFRRDPSSTDLDSSPFCYTYDILHKSVLEAQPAYAKRMKYWSKNLETPSTSAVVNNMNDREADSTTTSKKGYCTLVVFWIRCKDKIHEIHTIDCKYILHVIEDIQPSMYPFATLYCNEPAGDLIGSSPCAKIFPNSVAYNLINATLLTSEYRNQRPPKYINSASGLNIATFIQHGNDADYTFIVNGDATKAVHYHEFPQPSAYAQTIMAQLNSDIQLVSGVDARYTGRDTGSILTTGGVEAMLDQVTLIDTPKVLNYEKYTKRLTELIMNQLITNSATRQYYVQVPDSNEYKTIEIDFPELDKKEVMFEYEFNISTELPKNKARIAQAANVIMEKQMQYAQMGQQVELITPEEWLMCQDYPMKEIMLERMGIQRNATYTKRVMETLTTYASLVEAGMPADEAVMQTANIMEMNESPQAMMGAEMPPMQAAPEEEMMQAQGAALPMV